MEGLINFFEQYWGYTVIGGMSLGTIVTFIWVQVKAFIRDKAKNTMFEKTVNNMTEQVDTVVNKYNEVVAERDQLAAQVEYNNRVQATTFKAISYIVMASKLSKEDKIALQEDFTKLALDVKDVVAHEIKAVVEDTKVVIDKAKVSATEIVEEHKDVTTDIVKNSLSQTNSLLSKYTGDN